MSEALAVPPPRKLSFRSRFSFGFGSLAFGIKDGGFATFLLLYYNQVIGLPAASVGLAIMAALVIEAFVDPLVGTLSDRTHSRWGRRHPWMYASAIPVAVGWVLLWNPPAWGETATLFYLFGSALMVRVALSLFEIPSVSLGPELSSDYDERTKLFSYRYLFGWLGGLLMLFLAFGVFLVPTPDNPNGLTNAAGYSSLALIGAVIMAGAILLSSLGLHHEIPRLPKADTRQVTLGGHLREFRETVSNKAFVVLMAAGLFAYTAQGISFALSNYMYQFVWEFSAGTMQLVPLVLFVGAIMAFFVGPALSRGGDKAKAAMGLALVYAALTAIPYILRLTGVLPPVGTNAQIAVLFAFFTTSTACGIAAFIIGSSMMADVVEDSELRTGRRSEGVFFAGSFFVQKLVGGLGIGVAGVILALAQFPEAARPGQVPVGTIDRMTILFMVLHFGCGLAAALCYRFFPFGRAEHEARLARMAA
jgi:GPH family glycoside/pentoside/hexuronide:cation symporter